MLYDLNEKKITHLPHEAQFITWRQNLSNADYQAIVKALNDYCDTHETFMSSHIPGSNWSGTVYDPIYYACGQNDKHAGYFFGLIVWHVVQNRGDDWCFYRSDADDREYVGLTYFRKK